MKKVVVLGVIFVVVIAAIIILNKISNQGPGEKTNLGKTGPITTVTETSTTKVVSKQTTIRVGYTSKLLIINHLGQTLLRTNILDKNSLKGQITNFETEQSLVDIVSGGALDAAFVSDFSAVMAIGKGYNGLIVAYLGPLGRTDLVVLSSSYDSSIKSFQDVKGKSIGLTERTPAHRSMVKWLKEQSMKPEDIRILHFNEPSLQILEDRRAEAAVFTDPLLEILLRSGKVTSLMDSQYYGVVLISKDFYAKNPEAVYGFINSIKEAFFFVSSHKDIVNKWVEQLSAIPSEFVWACSDNNMFYSNRDHQINRIKIGLSDNFMTTLNDIAGFAYAQKLIPNQPVIADITDQKIISEAMKEIDSKTYKAEEVKVLQQ
ncbi:MAG: ABC transporter substrate-binding protein [Candidatus Paceibacterota bacterium]